MSTPNSIPMVPQPAERDETQIVVNTYNHPPEGGAPDRESTELLTEYLEQRFVEEPDPRTWVGFVETGRTLPGITRVPDGTKDVLRIRKTDKWVISPKVAAIATAASIAVAELHGNVGAIEDSAQALGHAVYRHFRPVEDTIRIIETPGPVSNITVNVTSANHAGEFQVSLPAVKTFENELQRDAAQGDRIKAIGAVSTTSDEFGSDASIGRPDAGNEALGVKRAADAHKALENAFANHPPVAITTTAQEHILSKAEKATLEKQARAAGFASLEEAVRAVDAGEKVDPALKAAVQENFTSQRRVILHAQVEKPGKATQKTETIPGKDTPPPTPHWKFKWFLPLPPIRRRKIVEEQRDKKRWQFIPRRPVLKPVLLHEDTEHAWVRLRPEALQEDGTLVDAPWTHTRKYEALVREGRIADILRADYQDPTGKDQSIRLMFVDQSPADEVVEKFGDLLEKLSAMDKGTIANRVSGIFVYPGSNAGHEHGDPKRIALGVDKQEDSGVIGEATPILELIEMHMPETWDPEKLATILEDTNGPLWTLAHEAAGHATDLTDEAWKVERVRVPGVPNAHQIVSSSWRNRMSHLLPALWHLRDHSTHPIIFDAEHTAVDRNGRPVSMLTRATEKNAVLNYSNTVTIVGSEPTRYAGESDGEHYAETAASVTTGIEIPFTEAGVHITRPIITDDGEPAEFATGYRPDVGAQRLFTDAIGAESGSFPATFSNPPQVTLTLTKPENDPLLRKAIIQSRSQRILAPEKMIAILAGIRRKAKK